MDSDSKWIVGPDEVLLITGANGFIGTKVVETLLGLGFNRIRCFVRPTGNHQKLEVLVRSSNGRVELLPGNLLSKPSCQQATKDVAVVLHLAAGMEKSFAGSFLNSAVTTRNLMEAALEGGKLKRFMNVGSFAVYSNMGLRRGAVLDETCPVETNHMERYDPYCFGKLKQDELVQEYGKTRGLPYVIVRPGSVYGPGVRQKISPRVGIDSFGPFLHLGGGGQVPLTYIDNCAEAMIYAALRPGIDGEIFNIVDDDLPSSRAFLKMYKRNVRPFRSFYIPYHLFYFISWMWEKYSVWSKGQLPPAFNRRRCAAYWKGNRYPNDKLKQRTGWRPKVPFTEAARLYFDFMRTTGGGIK